MFFPRKHLTLLGKPVPGHFTMVINDPLFFHEQLTKVGWPTQYTPERFGSEYANLGNQETDGHGLMMMAIYNVFKNSPDKAVFANENLKYIKEAAEYIRWSIENPDASLSQNSLLYGEGEATHGTGGYSMYANIPCALGLQGYAEIAETAGDAEAARSMRETAAFTAQSHHRCSQQRRSMAHVRIRLLPRLRLNIPFRSLRLRHKRYAARMGSAIEKHL